MERDKSFKLMAIGFIICVFIIGFLMVKLIDENKSCIENPFTYSASHVNVVGGTGDLLCSCSSGSDSFYFDEEGIYEKDPRYFTPNFDLP